VLRKGHILAILVIGVSIISIVSISAEESFIPSWIKNTASFWVDGGVTDQEFITSIEWMIENNLIKIDSEDNELEAQAGKLYQENPPLDKKYMQKEFKFSMWQPDNWEKQVVSAHPFDASLSVYSMIESSTFEEAQPTTIGVVIDDLEGLSLDEYNEDQWNKYGFLLSTIGQVEFLDAGRDTTAGEEDIWMEYTYDIHYEASMFNPVSIDVKLKGMDVVVGHRGDAYTITYLTSEENYDKHYDQFLDILDTFKFL